MECLPVGTRVCAYWSQKYHHLYPGAISDMDIDPKLDANYVNIELDDGDNRDIHVDSIRFLPPGYPLVGKFGTASKGINLYLTILTLQFMIPIH